MMTMSDTNSGHRHVATIFLFGFVVFSGAAVLITYYYAKALYIFLKPLPLMAILFYVFFLLPKDAAGRKYRRLILAAFFLSLIGDITLAIRHPLAAIGAVAFLAAHLFFIIAFWRGMGLTLRGIIFLGVIITVTFFFFAGLKPQPEKAPMVGSYALLIAYILIISTMVQTVLFAEFRINIFPLISIGAVLFFISDTVLAWRSAVSKFPESQVIVLTSYFLAQAFIAWGAVRLINKENHHGENDPKSRD